MSTIITIYLNGTGVSTNAQMLANTLHKITLPLQDHYSISVPGSAVNNPDQRDLGAVFAWNLETQIKALSKNIQAKINSLDSYQKLTLNLYGFSRGAVGAFLLCQQLKNIPADKLDINILAFDPVPGNFITSVHLDSLLSMKTTLSNQAYDLSDCLHIKNAQILFTNEPMSDIICHAPMLPIMPKSCHLEIDVLPGGHAGAQASSYLDSTAEILHHNRESKLAFHQAFAFLKDNGTHFIVDHPNALCHHSRWNADDIDDLLLNMIHSGKQVANQRDMHFNNKIISRQSGQYLNRFHKKLMGDDTEHTDDCLLAIKHQAAPTFRQLPWKNKLNRIADIILFVPFIGIVTAITAALVIPYKLLNIIWNALNTLGHWIFGDAPAPKIMPKTNRHASQSLFRNGNCDLDLALGLGLGLDLDDDNPTITPLFHQINANMKKIRDSDIVHIIPDNDQKRQPLHAKQM